MRYAILANPVSGRRSLDEKRVVLGQAAEVLGAEVHGLDTANREEFASCARRVAEGCDVLVVAGGDGSLSDVLNALDTTQIPLGYLPLGTGNAIGHALGYNGCFATNARKIREGTIRHCDLVECDGRLRGYLVSIGFDGEVIRLRDHYPDRFGDGLSGYTKATIRGLMREYRSPQAELVVDGATHALRRLFTLAVVKEPYYGYGLKMSPNARLDDGQLHLRALRAGVSDPVGMLFGGLTRGNRAGLEVMGSEARVTLDHPVWLQCDGNLGWQADHFSFRVLPRSWQLKY